MPPKKVEAEVTEEQIAERAYAISLTPESRTADENWHRAERELRGTDVSSSKAKARRQSKVDRPPGASGLG